MLPLPPVVLQLGWRNQVRLGRDYYVRVDSSDYSVNPAAIGRIIDVAADLEQVRVRLGNSLVAEHHRVWARGLTITDPDHKAEAARLRSVFQHPHPTAEDEMRRDLLDYDRAFGLNGENL